MKRLLIILFICLVSVYTKAQTANAGTDQIIYLSSGNTATLNGSSSIGTTFKWTEVTLNSWDYLSGATITNSTSKTATVSGLPQGTFYFNLAATTGSTTVNDLVTINIRVSPPLPTSTIAYPLNFVTIAPTVNNRTGDLVADYNGYPTPDTKNVADITPYGEVYIDRSHADGAYIDVQYGKYRSTIADGDNWNGLGYDRSENYFRSLNLASGTIYCFEIQWYWPQSLIGTISNPLGYNDIGAVMQVHGNDGNPPPFAFSANPDGSMSFREYGGSGNGVDSKTTIIPSGDANLLNKTHTIRLYLKEGTSNGFVKVTVDGILKYKRDGGGVVGQTIGSDWPKFCTIYDWGDAVVTYNNYTRHKTFSLITENLNVYTLTDTTGLSTSGGGITYAAPTANAGANQTITAAKDTLIGVATFGSGATGTTVWTKEVGPSATITSASSATTTVTGLTTGEYRFRFTANQSDAQTASDTVHVSVSISGAPTVSAGSNKTITLPTSTVTQTGTATAATGKTMSSYLWTKLSGPGTQTIGGNTTLTASISGLSTVGTYIFNLKGTQSDGQYTNSTVVITVNAAFAAPSVAAGADQSITSSTVSFTGSSTFASGATGTVAWTKEVGTGGTITSPTALNTTVTGLTTGEYRFKLTGTQSDGQIATDTVHVTVSIVAAPIVNTGSNQTIIIDSALVTATATWAAGYSGTYYWTQVSGPNTATIVSYLSASTRLRGLIPGAYVFKCNVTQSDGQTANSNITIVVTAKPTANAGVDQTITSPTSSKAISGSASNAAGTTATYLWTNISGPVTPTISNSITLSPTITGMSSIGSYTLRLTVTQSDGQIATDDVIITVNSSTSPPTVTNSGNQSIIVSTASVTSTAVAASGQTITTRLWTKVSGNGTITSPSSQNTGLTGLSGTSVFKITVTQTDGQTAYSTLTITVNVPPTVTTSGNQVLGTSSTSIYSTPTHAAGETITNYAWTQISGPTATINSPSLQNTSIVGLGVGVSQFRITVTQTDGQTAYSDVYITVNAAPTANAGVDQTIILPETVKALAGLETHAIGTTVTFLWSKVSGSGTQTITGNTTLSPTINGLTTAGTYVFNLNIIQSDGQIANNAITITVNPATQQRISVQIKQVPSVYIKK